MRFALLGVFLIAGIAIATVPVVSAAGSGAVNIVNFAFQDVANSQSIAGSQVNVPVTQINEGATVVWTLVEGGHTVTADDGSWGSAATLVVSGQTFSHTFVAPGVYTYHCQIHAQMRGVIVVVPTHP
jgi:plastocyanin